MQRVDAGGCIQQGVKASSKLIITKWCSEFMFFIDRLSESQVINQIDVHMSVIVGSPSH